MANYIDADLLRKEIKRLEKAAHKSALGCADSETRKFHEGKDYAYQHVGILIDSLQQEQPSENLEKEYEEYVDKDPVFGKLINHFAGITVARHFAEWQKEQMLKDAVEGEVCGRVRDHINVRFADGVCVGLEPKNISHIPADISKYAVGDKVKIVIVKED